MARYVAQVPLRWTDQDSYRHLNHARAVTLLEEARDSDVVKAFTQDLAAFRAALLRLGEDDGIAAACAARDRVSAALQRYMCRTERLGVTPDRDGMLIERTDQELAAELRQARLELAEALARAYLEPLLQCDRPRVQAGGDLGHEHRRPCPLRRSVSCGAYRRVLYRQRVSIDARCRGWRA